MALDWPFTMEEIKHTVDELPAEKAPGPNGFTGPSTRHVGTSLNTTY
jgi:hypothetical protein